MNLTDEEISKLENAKSADEWNATCDDIKRARGGQYPPDWFPRIIMSGFMSTVAARWIDVIGSRS